MTGDRRNITADVRMVEAVRLRHQESASFRQIAAALSCSVATAHEAYRRGVRDLIPAEDVAAARARSLDELDVLYQEAVRILRTDHVATSFGSSRSTRWPYWSVPKLRRSRPCWRRAQARCVDLRYNAARQHGVDRRPGQVDQMMTTSEPSSTRWTDQWELVDDGATIFHLPSATSGPTRTPATAQAPS